MAFLLHATLFKPISEHLKQFNVLKNSFLRWRVLWLLMILGLVVELVKCGNKLLTAQTGSLLEVKALENFPGTVSVKATPFIVVGESTTCFNLCC